MTSEIPASNPERREVLEDNARKFTLDALSPEFLEANGATFFTLTTDWLETDEDSEKKLAYRAFANSNAQILFIAKTTVDGNRTSEKQPITAEKYAELLPSSILRVEKTRYEFAYAQNGTSFSLKYDDFTGSSLRVLEVDAANEEVRKSFDPADFTTNLTEVTGDLKYYGYRVARVL